MATTTHPSEEGQLAQTVEMFEVITQSQPHDYQSLEILKEAYSKLGRDQDVVRTSKRIAQAYVQMGQLSSAILEYETILQRAPEDPEVRSALKEIESRANNFPEEPASESTTAVRRADEMHRPSQATGRNSAAVVDDGRRSMSRLFVDSKLITSGDFDQCWVKPDPSRSPTDVIQPFIQMLADKAILPLDKSLKLLCDRSRFAFLPLQLYDIDIDLARAFPAATCRRWCVLPIDRMSKSILVATVNPFNQQAAKELAEATANRLVWYIVPPAELITNIRKTFR
jgi:hypothetical protein